MALGNVYKLARPGTEFNEKKFILRMLPFLIILLIVMAGLLMYAEQRSSSSLSSSSESNELNEFGLTGNEKAKQLSFSNGWRSVLATGNHTGIWLGCYTELCDKDLGEKDYGRSELQQIVKSLGSNFKNIVVNPPYPTFAKIPPSEEESQSLDRGNTRIPVVVAQQNANSSSGASNVIITFTSKLGQVSNFDMAKYIADTGNRIFAGTVTTLVYKPGLLQDYFQLSDIPNTVNVLKTVRGQMKSGLRQGTPFKLGLLIDRNDCLQHANKIKQEIVPLVDLILYRTQHNYYEYHAPLRDGSRRVPHVEQQVASADPTPYHNAMISDLEKCEASLKEGGAELKCLPVVNCDKYWRQTYINWLTYEYKNLENLVKCWTLASTWAKRRKREVVLLLDREIEKYGWLQFLKHGHLHHQSLRL